MSSFNRRTLSRAVAALALIVIASSHAAAQMAAPYRIAYQIAMPRPETHLFEVRVDVEGARAGDALDFQMPRWSPGRYAVFDFAKNVQEVSAATLCPPRVKCERAALPVERLDTQTWRVVARGNSSGVSLSYKVFADDLSGTFSQLDARHANFNGGSVFAYVVGHKEDSVSLRIEPPRNWKIVNGYSTSADQREWEFANYDLMIDAPTEIAPDWTMQEFKVNGKTYRVVVHSFGNEGGKRDALARDVEKIVRTETALMGEPDYDGYTFLFHFDPTATRGDGMEHLTSTQIIETRSLGDRGVYDAAVETAAHEFFHVWNVKRLRPAGLGPWDFTRPVVTRGLWIAEGFTNYYGNLSLRRAGLWSDEQLLSAYANTIGGIESAPGSRLMSAEESSLLAPFLDRGTSDQRTNLANTSVSYYSKGETLGLVLDLLIRGRTRGRSSLDDVMRRAYEEFYLKSAKESYYLRGRGYTEEDFARVASEVAGIDLRDIFARYVSRAERPPYEEALAYVGLRLTRTPEAQPFNAGITLDFRNQQQPRILAVAPGSPAERAGLRQGDVPLSINNKNVTTQTWRAALNENKAGERVTLSIRRAQQTINADLILPAGPERFDYRIVEDEHATAEARQLRAAWLSGKQTRVQTGHE
ncbi:MAG: PDZ domain-containing protein [Pyrinomonadaceae bacterium]